MKEFKRVNIKYRLEYFILGLRDFIGFPVNPKKELKKLNLEKGQKILDYGCGIGSYAIYAAKLVGQKGKVYALDKEPLAIKKVEKRIKREGLSNIETILSDEDSRLPDESVDVVLLYGVLPSLENPNTVLKEIHRILKRDGYLSTRFCFRMKKDDVLRIVEETGLYVQKSRIGHIINFKKIEDNGKFNKKKE